MPQTVDAGPPVGLPFDAFQPVETSLCRPVAPDEGQPGAPGPHRRPVQRLMKARRSALITSACVVHMPCGNFS